jgi:hypothetical protein
MQGRKAAAAGSAATHVNRSSYDILPGTCCYFLPGTFQASPLMLSTEEPYA